MLKINLGNHDGDFHQRSMKYSLEILHDQLKEQEVPITLRITNEIDKQGCMAYYLHVPEIVPIDVIIKWVFALGMGLGAPEMAFNDYENEDG